MLARGTAAEIAAGDKNVAGLHPRGESGVEIPHAVRRKLGSLRRVEIARGDDDIRIDVITILVNCTVGFHGSIALRALNG